MKKLFLLKADFQDDSRADGKRYFCPDCVMIEGLLSYYPRLLNELEVKYVNFARPRPTLVNLLGEENQSCPVLVLEDGTFINDTAGIIQHLIEKHQIGHSH
jgi:hypothetical protein